jgi:hypothetical protein
MTTPTAEVLQGAALTSHQALFPHQALLQDMTVLLWSQRQNVLHIESVREMLESNIEALRCDRPMDYVVIYIGTQSECDKVAEAVHPKLWKREEARLLATGSDADYARTIAALKFGPLG